ncbi:hypothetical protein JCM1840_000467 [Sporobolomyces johnsonii]
MSTSRPSSRTDSDRPPLKRPRLDTDSLPNNPLKGKLRPKEPRDTVQISTWNVAGLYSCNAEKWKFGFRLYVEAEDAHILAITEVNEKDAAGVFEKDDNFAFLRERYPYRYWSPKVAILSKFKPIAPAVYGFPEGTKCDSEVEAESRAITLEFKQLFILATYVPNSGTNFKSLDRRKKWNADFEQHIRVLDGTKPVIWTGDFNVVRPYTTPAPSGAHRPNPHTPDVQWPQNWRRLSGTHEEEIKAHERLLGAQEELRHPRRPGRRFVDVWRLINGEGKREYTHTSKSHGGWRLDGFIVSERFLYRVRKCEIRYSVKEEFFPTPDVVRLGALSDHWPVWLSLEMERSDFEADGEKEGGNVSI